MTEPAELTVERVRRAVLEGKILEVLEDRDTVALLATQQDLEDIMLALAFYAAERDATGMAVRARAVRCRALADDLLRLNHEAFGQTSTAASPADRSSLDPLSRRKAEQRDGEKQHRTSGVESTTPPTAADS